jgi:hypothetical protein
MSVAVPHVPWRRPTPSRVVRDFPTSIIRFGRGQSPVPVPTSAAGTSVATPLRSCSDRSKETPRCPLPSSSHGSLQAQGLKQRPRGPGAVCVVGSRTRLLNWNCGNTVLLRRGISDSPRQHTRSRLGAARPRPRPNLRRR